MAKQYLNVTFEQHYRTLYNQYLYQFDTSSGVWPRLNDRLWTPMQYMEDVKDVYVDKE